MNIRIDTDTKKPAYMQVYEHLRDDIIRGAYPLGTRLPSKRTIASETGVSVITVEHALAMLCDEGYVEARQRSGVFVIYRKDDFQSNPLPAREHIIEAPGDKGSETFPFSVYAKTMRRVISDYGEKLLSKSPEKGAPELRSELCSYLYRSRNMVCDSSQVIVGAGAEYLYGLAAMLVGSNRIFAIEDPSYEKIAGVYKSYGIRFERLKLLKNGIASGELKKSSATVLHVTPFNSFPSGASADISKKHEYLSWAKNRHGYIIEDNYDSELTVSEKPEDSLFSLTDEENVIYINTFSGTIAPSIRMGYMLIPKQLTAVYEEKFGAFSCTVPLFEQLVVAELLRNGDFERNINRIRRKRRKA